MITRNQIADAYLCCTDYARNKVRAAGITHRKGLTLEEFKAVIIANGWPVNGKYDELAKRAMMVQAKG